jgi:hypothetical protein
VVKIDFSKGLRRSLKAPMPTSSGAAVQIGTAYLFCPEANLTPVHREALCNARDDDTVITNVFTGRPARGIANRLVREQGPLSSHTPEFPLAAAALAPLKAKSEAAGSGDFTNLWSGQAAGLARRSMPAGQLTRLLAQQTLEELALRWYGRIRVPSSFHMAADCTQSHSIGRHIASLGSCGVTLRRTPFTPRSASDTVDRLPGCF